MLLRHFFFFFFNDTATTEIYTLSLHDALPISSPTDDRAATRRTTHARELFVESRSEEHTSELQSHSDLVCRLLLEKKKTTIRELSCATIPSVNLNGPALSVPDVLVPIRHVAML